LDSPEAAFWGKIRSALEQGKTRVEVAEMDIEALASPRFQSAFTVAVQLIFPSLTMGLAGFLAVMESLWIVTRAEPFRGLYTFWVRIFAVVFALGVASLVLIGGQLGWDWTFLQTAISMGLLAGLVAAMLSTRRLGDLPHFAASLLTAVGAVAVTAWLVAVDSRAGRLAAGFDVRFAYTAFSAYLVTSLGIGAASAWRLLKRPDEAESALALRMAVGMVAITAPLVFLTIDLAPHADRPHAVVSAAELTGWTVHAAATLGLALTAVALSTGGFGLRPGGFERSRAFLRACIGMGALGLVALLTGWIAGRSSPNPLLGAVPHAVGWSPGLAMGAALTFGVGAVWILRMIARGPKDSPDEAAQTVPHGPRSASTV